MEKQRERKRHYGMSLRFAVIIQVIGYLVVSLKQLDYVDSKKKERVHKCFLSGKIKHL